MHTSYYSSRSRHRATERQGVKQERALRRHKWVRRQSVAGNSSNRLGGVAVRKRERSNAWRWEREGVCFVFFFQAEDGIRDRDVTGVQTCALPICRASRRPDAVVCVDDAEPVRVSARRDGDFLELRHIQGFHRYRHAEGPNRTVWLAREIGRASCRERV